MLHIPEALRHTLMPWTSTWVNQEKINNISLKFCLKMFIMLHIPEALRHTVMPRTPTWVNEKGIQMRVSTQLCYFYYRVYNRASCLLVYFLTKEFIDV